MSGDNPNTLGADAVAAAAAVRPQPGEHRPRPAGSAARRQRRRAAAHRGGARRRRGGAQAGRAPRRCWRCSNDRRAATCRERRPARPTRAACSRAPRPRCVSPRSRTGPGAISLIELLEAQRTYLDTQAQYLRALYDFRQATVDVVTRRRRAMTVSQIRRSCLCRCGRRVAVRVRRRLLQGPRRDRERRRGREAARLHPLRPEPRAARLHQDRDRAGGFGRDVDLAAGAGRASTRTTRSGSRRRSTAAPSGSW